MYLTQALHRALQQDPDGLHTVNGTRRRTVRESVDRIARLGGALTGLGIRPGDRVAILAHNSDRFHEYLLATWWVGAVVNPINTRWSAAEVRYAVEQSGSRVLFVDDAFADHVPEVAGALDVVIHCGDQTTPAGMLDHEDLISGSEPVADARVGGDTLAAVLYTGGTSGFPKGVMLSHENIMVSTLGAQATMEAAIAGGRTLHAAPLFHSAGLVAWNFQLVVGGSHVFLPSFDPVAAMTVVQEHRVTSAMLPPVMIQMLLDHPSRESFDLSSLRRLLYGASPMPEALLQRALAALPGVSFMQAYGMTELAPIATLLTGDDHRAGLRLRSAGRPALHCEVKIVDPDGRELPPGEVGEVAVRGGHVMHGYWEQPDETAAVLRDGWMHTGDGGYLDDAGYLFIVDRLKDMIVTGGENVFSAEVENVLALHPSVASCAVIGIPDATYGESVHAVVVLRSGMTTSAAELRRHCKESIAGYKAPRTAEFVAHLPVTSTGKINKRDLRDPHWSERSHQIS